MKSFYVKFSVDDVTIPFAYSHQVQSLIYSILKAGGNRTIHIEEPKTGTRNYKFFSFGRLLGGTVCADRKHLHFDSSLFLEVRSCRSDFCEAFQAGLASGESFKLFNAHLTVASVNSDEKEITESNITIKMLSPVTVHVTNENKYTRYLTPLDPDFSDEISKNFIRKYHAFYRDLPIDGVKIKALNVGMSDRRVSLYKKAQSEGEKDYYITGWTGIYELTGRPEHLTFLYYSGIGANNSAGFGMFDVI